MEESIYSKLPKLKIEISLTTLVAAVLILIFAFIIPITLLQNLPQNSGTQGTSGAQVAGVSTSKEDQKITLPIINQRVVLEGQSGILILIGIALLFICFAIITFIAIDSLRKHKKN